ncbi:MAG: Gfo/Idh/MocA family protein, partial [bacterium]
MHDQSRRDFLATTAAIGAAGLVAPLGFGGWSQAKGPGRLVRIGLVGCGGRGSGAANDTLTANPDVKLVAMCDIDLEKAKGVRDALKEAHSERANVADDRIFGGLDGYQKLLALPDVDLVILATAPGFRPVHIAAAVAAKKHIFAEKPVCVDVAGYHA